MAGRLDGRDIVPVQAGWPFVAVEQYGDAGVVMAQGDNDATLVSQIGATHSAKLTHFEAGADCNSIRFQIHDSTPQKNYKLGFNERKNSNELKRFDELKIFNKLKRAERDVGSKC